MDPSLTAGFWLQAYTGTTEAELLGYARSLAIKTDSAILALRDNFQGTSGQPMPGAANPVVISSRERNRWQRCRLIHFDLRTLSDAAAFLKDSIPGGTSAERAAMTLADAFEGLQATEECDIVASMIEVPDRYQPWQQSYENSARSFYRDWYTQLRALHEANRAFVRGINAALGPARALPLPSAMPLRTPTLGGSP